MKKSYFKLYIIELFLFVIFLLSIFVTNTYKDYILCLLLLFVLVISVLLLGYEKANHRYKKDIVLSILIYTLSYHILTYTSGLIFGFVRTGYSLSMISIIKNIAPLFIIAFISEILRYEINTKGNKKKSIIVLSIILFIVLDITVQVRMYDFKSIRSVIEMIAMVILPSISKNILLTYISLKFGWLPNVAYRFMIEIPIYVIPIFPNINTYLKSVIMLLLPAIILYRITELYKNKRIREVANRSIISRVSTVLIISVAVIGIGLTSGAFKYYAISLGSSSMKPAMSKGDVVIVKKTDDTKLHEFKEEDILVYKYNDKVIVHRIVKIEIKDNQYYFTTKGDTNKNEDSWTVNGSNVLGKAVFKIPYIGYPTVWLNEALSGGANE